MKKRIIKKIAKREISRLTEVLAGNVKGISKQEEEILKEFPYIMIGVDIESSNHFETQRGGDVCYGVNEKQKDIYKNHEGMYKYVLCYDRESLLKREINPDILKQLSSELKIYDINDRIQIYPRSKFYKHEELLTEIRLFGGC